MIKDLLNSAARGATLILLAALAAGFVAGALSILLYLAIWGC